MTKEEKINIVDKLSKKITQNSCFYIIDASGLTVEQINSFRRLCFREGIEYSVYKNTLIRKALELKKLEDKKLFDVLKGFSGIIFSKKVNNIPAKTIQEYCKTGDKKILLKMASIDADFYFGNNQLDILSKIKSKNELIGDIVLALQSPIRNVISSLLSGQHIISNVLKALEQKTK